MYLRRILIKTSQAKTYQNLMKMMNLLVVGSDTNGRLQDKDLNDGIAYSETANLHENV